jgi:hypothetical protein
MSALQNKQNNASQEKKYERFSFKAVNANYPMRRNPDDVWNSIDENAQPENEMTDSRKILASAFGFVHVMAAFTCLYYISAQFMSF